MRIYISADMEGVTGVTHPQDVIPGRSQYERFRRLLTADVNAAIEGAAQAGGEGGVGMNTKDRKIWDTVRFS